jgi:hypothetical protein
MGVGDLEPVDVLEVLDDDLGVELDPQHGYY